MSSRVNFSPWVFCTKWCPGKNKVKEMGFTRNDFLKLRGTGYHVTFSLLYVSTGCVCSEMPQINHLPPLPHRPSYTVNIFEQHSLSSSLGFPPAKVTGMCWCRWSLNTPCIWRNDCREIYKSSVELIFFYPNSFCKSDAFIIFFPGQTRN